jgi:hypothetical protein
MTVGGGSIVGVVFLGQAKAISDVVEKERHGSKRAG